MLFRIKTGVDVTGLRPEMVPALLAAYGIRAVLLGGDLVLTSAREGDHRSGSRHFVGLALDFRTRDLLPRERSRFASELRAALGDQYDVLLEGDHLHVEFDPR